MGKITSSEFDLKYRELSIAMHEFNDAGVILQLGFAQSRDWEQEHPGEGLLDAAELRAAIDQAAELEWITQDEAKRLKSGEMTEEEAAMIQEREELAKEEVYPRCRCCMKPVPLHERVVLQFDDGEDVMHRECAGAIVVESQWLIPELMHAIANVLGTHCLEAGAPPRWKGTSVQRAALGDLYKGLEAIAKTMGPPGMGSPFKSEDKNFIVISVLTRLPECRR